MLLLLPSAWLACFLLFRELAQRRGIGTDWRLSFLQATLAWGALVTLGTEALSAAAALNRLGVLLWWTALNLAAWGALFSLRRQSAGTPAPWDFSKELKDLAAWPLDARLTLGAAIAFTLPLGAIALWTPTNNWDSLTYHMARVMHWLQQQSVAHYPTNMEAQIQMGPWSAFVQAHLWLLWGSDRFANLLQWSAMGVSMIAGTLIVRQLLPENVPAARAEGFAALLVVTLPTGIVESITTQTDYTTGMWLLSLAALALAWWQEPANRAYGLGFGAALGLGILTKFTMAIYAAPIGLVTAAAVLWKERRAPGKVVLLGVVSLALCLGLLSPHLIRNQMVYGSAVGSKDLQRENGTPAFSVAGILSNIIRNAALHSNTGMPRLTHVINWIATTAQSWTGRPPDDPEFTSGTRTVTTPPDQFLVFDSFAASPWQVMLILAAVVAGPFVARKEHLAPAALCVCLAGVVVFCSVLRWQIWNSRYHLPLLLLFMPVVAALLAPRFPRWLTGILGAGLLAFGFVIVASNQSRPVFDASFRAQPRLQKYFFSPSGAQFYEPMRAAAGQIVAAGCSEVGLKLSADDAEYPLWLMLREAGFKGRIDHQFVSGPSSRLPGPERLPDVIITTLSGGPEGDLAGAFPTRTKIGPYTLYWSAKASGQQAPSSAKH